ncbi:cag pathogenicity island protein Y [Helicobacter pylori Aklavik117]|nr:cag pathogenicity island protein Y [Helicobacter pylori Aklavik117]
MNLYSDLIEEIQDKKSRLEKQNQLSKTERLHKATECLNDLDDPTDEEAIEQCLDDLSDSEHALVLELRSQADKVAFI